MHVTTGLKTCAGMIVWLTLYMGFFMIGCASSHDGRAETVYSQRCSGCHGVSGDGQGEIAKHLPDQPTNFADPNWQRSVSREYLKTVIAEGGTKVGISPLMPSNTDLKTQEKRLSELVNFVLTLGK